MLLLSPVSSSARTGAAMPTMPVSAIKPGMKGEWRTVISGTRIVRFPMEVVGVAQNFIGPRQPVILCKALDATNKLTGPVAGMSGSPVFIHGKLIGAYAYGFLYPKDQALFGVTPIADMLKVEQDYSPAGSGSPQGPTEVDGGDAARWTDGPLLAANLPPLDDLQSSIRPLPTPLFVSGISERTLRQFSPQMDKLGLHLISAPSGQATGSIDTNLEPGSAVSGVLMSGDFDMTGTGTVTWRHGNRILAFGHPFLQNGPIEMPMAAAEILTVVQSSQRSFKLPNLGPIVGSIYQDRLTAIAGEIGRMAPTTHFVIHLEKPNGRDRVFQGDMFEHQDLSPALSAMALSEGLGDVLEAGLQETIYLKTTVRVAGHNPIRLSDVASGNGADFVLANRQLRMYSTLLSNPCQFPNVTSLVFRARLVQGWRLSRLDFLSIDRDQARPGDVLQAVIGLRNYRGEPRSVPVSVPIPADLRAPRVFLFVGDADAALRMDDLPAVLPRTLHQVLARLRRRRSHRDICVKLLRTAPGLAVEGRNLPDLPPSVMAQFDSPNSDLRRAALNWITLWETNIPVAGAFSGQKIMPVRIK